MSRTMPPPTAETIPRTAAIADDRPVQRLFCPGDCEYREPDRVEKPHEWAQLHEQRPETEHQHADNYGNRRLMPALQRVWRHAADQHITHNAARHCCEECQDDDAEGVHATTGADDRAAHRKGENAGEIKPLDYQVRGRVRGLMDALSQSSQTLAAVTMAATPVRKVGSRTGAKSGA